MIHIEAIVVRSIEFSAAILIAFGAAEALYGAFRAIIAGKGGTLRLKKLVWTRFAMWLLMALEFELAADILKTAISPGWTDVGQLAAIALIRTFLSYFLEKDIEKFEEPVTPMPSSEVQVPQNTRKAA